MAMSDRITTAGNAPDAVSTLTGIVMDVFGVTDPIEALGRAGAIFNLLMDAGLRVVNGPDRAGE